MKYYIGIDNGVTGSVAVLNERGEVMLYAPTPVREVLNYTKAKKIINRLDGNKLREMLEPYVGSTVLIERPMINPMRFDASVSAIRCDEATLIIIEGLSMRHKYCDSRDWQKPMLPGLQAPKRSPKGSTAEVKKANKAFNAKLKRQTKKISLAQGKQLYPELELAGDADALLIAEWARQEQL